MALTQTAEYALRAVVWLAQHPGEPQTTQQIADATQVPFSYLPKVLQPLVRSGLIAGQRGLRGGYTLCRDAAEISLLDVVQQVDPIQRIESCPLALGAHTGRLCPLHQFLDQLLLAEATSLGATQIGDLTTCPGEPAPLCPSRAALHAEAEAEAGTAGADAACETRPEHEAP